MKAAPAVRLGFGESVVLAGVGAAFAIAMGLWIGAESTALLRDKPRPHHGVEASLRLLVAHPGDPSAAWGQRGLSGALYWMVTGVILFATVTLVVVLVVLYRRSQTRTAADPRRREGLADGRQIAAAAGRKALLRRGRLARPSMDAPKPQDVGYRLGRAQGRDVWVSVEDSMVVLGPPRSGKGLHLVIPMILDAPGAVVTTSTRPDNLNATREQRWERGPIAVFDPQRLASDELPTLRWSPIRGCANPQTAMIRARALAAGTSRGTENADFWQAQTEAVLRCFLHAAALSNKLPSDLYRWSLSPTEAEEAGRVLSTTMAAASGWSAALSSALKADPRTRDSIWVGVRTALDCLADPNVLAAVSPDPGESFDPDEFLAQSGTLYLLGTAAGAGATANLIAAYLEDVVEAARRLSARSPGGRLDPPLALVLDEVANYPLPSLPTLMSDGGGSGVTTVAVLQSLAQARACWGEQRGAAIWDSAIVKVILGGGSNARDLADLSALIGDRDDDTVSESRDWQGHRSYSHSVRRVPILDTGQLRTLPFGTGVLLLRSAPPVVLDLQPWTDRRLSSSNDPAVPS